MFHRVAELSATHKFITMGWFTSALKGVASGGMSTAANGLLSGAIGNIFSKQAAKREFNYTKKLMDKQQEMQKELIADNAMLTKGGLQKAGLSPSMMMNGVPSPASAPSGDVSSSPMATSVSNVSPAEMAQVDLLNANKENVEEDTRGKKIDNDNKQQGYDLSFAKVIAETNKFTQEAALQEVNTRQAEVVFRNMQRQIDKSLEKMDAETQQALAAVDRWEQEKPYFAKKLEQDILEGASRIKLNNAQAFQAYKLGALYMTQQQDLKHQIDAKLQEIVGPDGVSTNAYNFLVRAAALEQSSKGQLTQAQWEELRRNQDSRLDKELHDIDFTNGIGYRIWNEVKSILGGASSGAGAAAIMRFFK